MVRSTYNVALNSLRSQ